jgi:hypothetical protein
MLKIENHLEFIKCIYLMMLLQFLLQIMKE